MLNIEEATIPFMEKMKLHIKSKSIFHHIYRLIEGVLTVNAYGLNHNHSDFSTKDWVNTGLQSKLNYESIMNDRIDNYTNRLKKLLEKVADFDSKAIFVTQSSRRNYDFFNGQLKATPTTQNYDGHLINGIDYYYMSRILNQRTKSVCEGSQNCIFIDLDSELSFDLASDFYDYCHNTPSGAKKIGVYLFSKLNHLF